MTAEQDNFIAGVEAVVNRILDNVSTSFPATIIEPLPAQDGLVNVQPNCKIKFFGDNEEVEPKPINNVVLVYANRTNSTISRPPKESLIGSKVLVHITHHSLTEWRSSNGKSVFPEESRRFNINDAVAVLGMYSELTPWPNPQLPNTFEILGLEGVKIKIGTQTADLVGLTNQILTLMSAGVDPDTGVFLSLVAISPLLVKLATISNPV